MGFKRLMGFFRKKKRIWFLNIPWFYFKNMFFEEKIFILKIFFCKKKRVILKNKELGKSFWEISWVFPFEKIWTEVPMIFMVEGEFVLKTFFDRENLFWRKRILKEKDSWVLFSKEEAWVPKILWFFFFFGGEKMFHLETLLIQKISFIIFFEKKFECDKIKK